MADFSFIKNKQSGKWTILAPRRQTRPNEAHHTEPAVCPFCPGREGEEEELYRIQKKEALAGSPSSFSSELTHSIRSNIHNIHESGSPVLSSQNNLSPDWLVRVIPNKFPFAKVHEVVIHSPDHHKNFDELPVSHVGLILKTFKERFQLHQDMGQVYIFHNHGEAGGESLHHPHTQLAVLPHEMELNIPKREETSEVKETKWFDIFCPESSQWPDEVWIGPKRRQKSFGEITSEELTDLMYVLNHIIQLLDMRHGNEFPYNFYIYPGTDWYLRIIPRLKRLGGLEVGTSVFVNTQDPKDTFAFINEHFGNPDEDKIKTVHKAEYRKSV